MAARSQRYAQLLSSHPYHSSISSAPSFALDGANGGDDDHGTGAGAAAAMQDDGFGALAELPRCPAAFVSPARTADAAEGAGDALRGALLVETYSSDPRAEFLESMAEMAAACGAEGMPAPERREFMEELLSCYLERNDRAVHRHVLAAFADLAARRRPTSSWKRRMPLRGLMKITPVRFRHMML